MLRQEREEPRFVTRNSPKKLEVKVEPVQVEAVGHRRRDSQPSVGDSKTEMQKLKEDARILKMQAQIQKKRMDGF